MSTPEEEMGRFDTRPPAELPAERADFRADKNAPSAGFKRLHFMPARQWGKTYASEMAKFDTGKMAGTNNGRGFNQTSAGGYPFYALDPRPEEIRIEEIAAQLSRVCRFNGAIRDEFDIYSVAQHCCLVSDHCPPEHQMEGLLHDAHEYMLGDMSKPIKMNLAILAGADYWKQLEHIVEGAVRAKFGLPLQMTPAVKEQDYIAVATEHRDLQVHTGKVDWGNPPPPWPGRIVPWSPKQARSEFMFRFTNLYKGD